ncbi:PqqD family protein [Bacteroides propionicifaciens]|uniref:PqqD family protein n=1 Tax=Bacteroides propionicifaciens TaxID=392838 RepID=UPI00037C1E0E|nr:PqqD family protein [Bacteroides propionicifaciens]
MRSENKVFIMDVIPSKLDNIHTLIAEDGKVTLGIQRFRSKWINKYFMPKKVSPVIRVPLDKYGSQVWKLIDGQSDISKIIEQAQSEFPEEENFDKRIITYLYQLKKDKLIDFLIVNK